MTEHGKKRLIIITGPTACGKSDTAVMLAQKTGGMIISADSVQVYKGMDIGSAKISKEEMKGIPHFLIDSLEPDMPFNVSEFVDMAEDAIETIYSAGAVPIIVGGTAFYIQALLKGVEFSEDTGADDTFRKDAEDFYKQPDEGKWLHLHKEFFHGEKVPVYSGEDTMYELLRAVDPESSRIIHKNNHKRVIRALEYYKATGEAFSDYNRREGEKGPRYDHSYFVLSDDRESLYRRINERVDKMIADGLEGEVRGLLEKGYGRDLKSMRSIGYKEMCDYIYGDLTFDAAVEAIKQNTRHFAKRQMTWFRREKNVIPVDIMSFDRKSGKIADYIYAQCCLEGHVCNH